MRALVKCLLMMELTCINRTAKSITMNLLIDAIVKTLNKFFFVCVWPFFAVGEISICCIEFNTFAFIGNCMFSLAVCFWHWANNNMPLALTILQTSFDIWKRIVFFCIIFYFIQSIECIWRVNLSVDLVNRNSWWVQFHLLLSHSWFYYQFNELQSTWIISKIQQSSRHNF